jgi:hypothetical protein
VSPASSTSFLVLDHLFLAHELDKQGQVELAMGRSQCRSRRVLFSNGRVLAALSSNSNKIKNKIWYYLLLRQGSLG